MDNMEIGKRLYELRNSKNLTQKQTVNNIVQTLIGNGYVAFNYRENNKKEKRLSLTNEERYQRSHHQ